MINNNLFDLFILTYVYAFCFILNFYFILLMVHMCLYIAALLFCSLCYWVNFLLGGFGVILSTRLFFLLHLLHIFCRYTMSQPLKCSFCGREDENEVEFGKLYTVDEVSVHYFCLVSSFVQVKKGFLWHITLCLCVYLVISPFLTLALLLALLLAPLLALLLALSSL